MDLALRHTYPELAPGVLSISFEHCFAGGELVLGISRRDVETFKAQAGQVIGLASLGAMGFFGLQARCFHGYDLKVARSR